MRFETHSHTMYSNIRLLDSTNKPEDLIKTAAELGLAGIAITDHEALCAHVDVLNIEKDYKKNKIIPDDFKIALGNEIYLIEKRSKEPQKYFHFILIAKDSIGHRALRELSGESWKQMYETRRMERVPTTYDELEAIVHKYQGHLIATSACIGGFLGNTYKDYTINHNEEAKAAINKYINYCVNLFGEDFYLEMAPSNNLDQIMYNKFLLDLNRRVPQLKLEIGTDAHYLRPKDRCVHKAFLNSQEREREVDAFYASAYLMSDDEVYEYFKDYLSKDKFEEICQNSIGIRDKITDNYELFHDPDIPTEKVKFYEKQRHNELKDYPFVQQMFESDNEQDRYTVNECIQKLSEKKLYNNIYLNRLNKEFDIIATLNKSYSQTLNAYFNAFQSYIDCFWECGSIIETGRGSSCGFLINYLLGITQVDPIVWKLNEWRFLNKERVELPDIDCDSCPSKRDIVLNKLRERKGGADRVVFCCTFGTMTTKAAILAACRGYRTNEFPKGIDPDVGLYLSSLVDSERGFVWSLSDCVNGNVEKQREPNKAFINKVNEYDGLLDIMMGIEGLIKSRGCHASGVIFFDKSPYETNTLMRSPKGELVTQYDLHQSEQLGNVKFDILITSVCDTIVKAIEFLQKNGYFDKNKTLKEIYYETLIPDKLPLSDERIWQNLYENKIIDCFQWNEASGQKAISLIHPHNVMELTAANALMRLMPQEKGQEAPMAKYARFKENMGLWDEELRNYGLTEADKNILRPYYEADYGVPPYQESVMMILMDKDISDFSLKDANAARKIIAKKQMNKIPQLREQFFSSCKNKNLANYVWDTSVKLQLGYSFSINHSLPYSFIGIQTMVLATCYPSIYWNTACLIVNSRGELTDSNDDDTDIDYYSEDDNNNADESDDDTDENDDDIAEVVTTKKKTNKTAKYGKISMAIAQIQKGGVKVLPPDINISTATFQPEESENAILYGLKGIKGIGDELVKEIIVNRPYYDFYSFKERVHCNKTQLMTLIKCGAFDNLQSRRNLMEEYLYSISEVKNTLNLRNLAKIIEYKLLPPTFNFQIAIFLFTKELKKKKEKGDEFYELTDEQSDYLIKNFNGDLLNSPTSLNVALWKKYYDKQMLSVKQYIKDNLPDLLNRFNQIEIDKVLNKYSSDNTEDNWEMTTVGFYSKHHELADISYSANDIVNFFELPEEPEIDKIIYMQGREVPLYKLNTIIGTVVERNKLKKTVALLTPEGLVTVKLYKELFTELDKRISEVNADGRKTIKELSWFTRGNKLEITGIRRGDDFIPKKYKYSRKQHPIQLITSIDGLTYHTIDKRYGE